MFIPLFFAELFLLFLLSRMLTKNLSSFFYRVTQSKKITIWLMATLFFPGTVLHEVAHYLMARILFVPAYQIEFFPKLEGENLKLGSVSIGRTDYFRRLLIGAAPFLVGTTCLLLILFYGTHNNLFANYFFVLMLGYAVFEIGNTMFSSKKDMEGAKALLLAIILIIGALYFAGFRLPMMNPEVLFANPVVKELFEKGSLFLLAPIGIDAAIIILLKLFRHKL